jgi:hypothetical protein
MKRTRIPRLLDWLRRGLLEQPPTLGLYGPLGPGAWWSR